MKRLFICMLTVMLVLSGCSSSKNTQPVGGTSTKSEASDPVTEPVKEEEIEPEEAEPVEDDESKDTMPDAILAEYLISLDASTYATGKNWGYKKSRFYADDINEDGYPEVCQYMELDVTATIKDFSLAVYTIARKWNEEKHREEYFADIQFTNESRHNSIETFGTAEIVLSYTRGTEPVLMHYETCSGNESIQTTYDELKSFRDGKFLDSGSARKEVTVYSKGYLVYAPDYKTYGDEEHYESFDRGGDYETVIRFGTVEGWTTLQDALDHLGELPQE